MTGREIVRQKLHSGSRRGRGRGKIYFSDEGGHSELDPLPPLPAEGVPLRKKEDGGNPPRPPGDNNKSLSEIAQFLHPAISIIFEYVSSYIFILL